MNDEELKKIGEWLNSKGHCIDLTDDFWMEEYDWGEYKTRDICQILFEYRSEQCNIANDVGQNEQLADHKCKPMVSADWTYLRCECGKRFEPKI